MIDLIIKMEWEMFDKTRNKGGRADCQDDFSTFNIMRKSQFMVYDSELLENYYNDLTQACKTGRNLIMEKYARMMKTTVPEEYKAIEKYLPYISDEHARCVENITEMQVGMMEEFAKKYPKMANNARSIHTSEDSEYNTSYETYLRGEMLSYSYESAKLYERMLKRYEAAHKNIARDIMENTAKLYGYDNLEHAEESL